MFVTAPLSLVPWRTLLHACLITHMAGIFGCDAAPVHCSIWETSFRAEKLVASHAPLRFSQTL